MSIPSISTKLKELHLIIKTRSSEFTISTQNDFTKEKIQ